MRRGLATALAAAGLLNLWAVSAGPLAQEPSQAGTSTTPAASPTPQSQTQTPSPQPQPAAAPPTSVSKKPQGGHLVIHAATGGRHALGHAHKKSHVKAAGDPGVTIKDFSFGPSSVTVHVGDTVSWSNAGKSPHTATAN